MTVRDSIIIRDSKIIRDSVIIRDSLTVRDSIIVIDSIINRDRYTVVIRRFRNTLDTRSLRSKSHIVRILNFRKSVILTWDDHLNHPTQPQSLHTIFSYLSNATLRCMVGVLMDESKSQAHFRIWSQG